MANVPNREQLDALVAGITNLGSDVQQLQIEVETDRISREEETRSRKEETKKIRWLIFLAGLVGVIGLSVGGWGLNRASVANGAASNANHAAQVAEQAANNAQSALDQAKVQADQVRKNGCIQDNKFFTAHNNLVQKNIDERRAVIDQTEAGDSTPEQKATTRAFFEAQIADYEANRVPLRDCSSKAAIDAYLLEQGG